MLFYSHVKKGWPLGKQVIWNFWPNEFGWQCGRRVPRTSRWGVEPRDEGVEGLTALPIGRFTGPDDDITARGQPQKEGKCSEPRPCLTLTHPTGYSYEGAPTQRGSCQTLGPPLSVIGPLSLLSLRYYSTVEVLASLMATEAAL